MPTEPEGPSRASGPEREQKLGGPWRAGAAAGAALQSSPVRRLLEVQSARVARGAGAQRPQQLRRRHQKRARSVRRDATPLTVSQTSLGRALANFSHCLFAHAQFSRARRRVFAVAQKLLFSL
jgi:hypothetical protein